MVTVKITTAEVVMGGVMEAAEVMEEVEAATAKEVMVVVAEAATAKEVIVVAAEVTEVAVMAAGAEVVDMEEVTVAGADMDTEGADMVTEVEADMGTAGADTEVVMEVDMAADTVEEVTEEVATGITDPSSNSIRLTWTIFAKSGVRSKYSQNASKYRVAAKSGLVFGNGRDGVRSACIIVIRYIAISSA